MILSIPRTAYDNGGSPTSQLVLVITRFSGGQRTPWRPIMSFTVPLCSPYCPLVSLTASINVPGRQLTSEFQETHAICKAGHFFAWASGSVGDS